MDCRRAVHSNLETLIGLKIRKQIMKGRVFNYALLTYLEFVTKIGKTIIDPNMLEEEHKCGGEYETSS